MGKRNPSAAAAAAAAHHPTPMDSEAEQTEMKEAMSPEELLASLKRKLIELDVEMHAVDDKISVLIEKMPKPTVSEFGKKSQPIETDAGDLEEFKERFNELKLEAEKVSNQITEIRLREQGKEDAMLLIPELIVIAFVNELEKADQYFDLKEYLKVKDNITEDSNGVDVAKELLLQEEICDKFDKLDKNIIGHAVAAVISQKRVENASAKNLKHIEYLNEFEKWEWEWEGRNMNISMLEFTEEYYNDKAGSCPILELGPKEIDRHAITHPICNLVFLAREKRNVMDQDPKEMLKKIEDFDSLFFHRYIKQEFPRTEFEKIMSTCKDTLCEEALSRVRNELYKEALDRYNTFTKKYGESKTEDTDDSFEESKTEDTDNPFEDKLMLDSNRKRASESKNVGVSSQSLPSARTRSQTQPHRSVRTRTQKQPR